MHIIEPMHSSLRSKKRPSSGNCDDEPEAKQQASSSVMGEALKNELIQCVNTTVQKQLKIFTKKILRRIDRLEMKTFESKQEIQSCTQSRVKRSFLLRISHNLPKMVYAGEKITGIEVSLHDALTDEIITGPESSLMLKVVVLQGDFNPDNNKNWTEEEFDSVIVGCRNEKPPLLTGNLKVAMKDGTAEVGEFVFTDNSSWVKSKKFCLGIKVSSGGKLGIRIREAVSNPFPVRSSRGASNMKHYPPLPKDEVWRLEKIRKDGRFAKRLKNAQITTVEQFVDRANRDENEMRQILETMSNKQWKALLFHARTCKLPQRRNTVREEEHLPSIGSAAPLQRVISGAAGHGLQEENHPGNSFCTELMDYLLGGDGCSSFHDVPSFESVPNYQCFGEYVQQCSSEKAVLGWSKVKAALQWGIFVKRKAAQRRFQLTELRH